MTQINKNRPELNKNAALTTGWEVNMHAEFMTLPEMATYLGISQTSLVRALCNRGALYGVPLTEGLEHLPLTQRHWLREDVRQFKHALQRAHVVHHH